MGKMTNAYKILVGRPEGLRALGSTRRKRKDNIRTDLREKGREGGDWIQLAQDRGQWWVFVNAVMNIRVP
jgi:hypothetical protein